MSAQAAIERNVRILGLPPKIFASPATSAGALARSNSAISSPRSPSPYRDTDKEAA